MLIKPELIKRVKEYFDLNIYETKAWLALLTKGIASAGEIAELSGVPRSRTYDVLESLEKRGFAIKKIGKPVKYISVKPTEVLEKMKSRVMQEAQEKVNSLSNLKQTSEYTELEQIHNAGLTPVKFHEITGSLRGRQNILSRIREILENAKKEVIICSTISDMEDKSRVIIPAIEKLSKKDVKLKIAISGDLEKIKRFSSRHNLKVKQTDTQATIFISDRKEILLMLTPDNADEEIGVWLNSPFLIESLSHIVEKSLKNGVSDA